MEYRAAVDAGDVVAADKGGVVSEVSADHVTVANDDGTYETYRLRKFDRSNQGTCFNQRTIVDEGQRVEEGQVIADGPVHRHRARWRSAATCSWRSCRGRATTTRTRSS